MPPSPNHMAHAGLGPPPINPILMRSLTTGSNYRPRPPMASTMSYLSNSNSNNHVEGESLRTDEDTLEFQATLSGNGGHEFHGGGPPNFNQMYSPDKLDKGPNYQVPISAQWQNQYQYNLMQAELMHS